MTRSAATARSAPTPATAAGRALLDWLRDYRHFQPNELTQVRNRLRAVQREARAAAIAQVRVALREKVVRRGPDDDGGFYNAWDVAATLDTAAGEGGR